MYYESLIIVCIYFNKYNAVKLLLSDDRVSLKDGSCMNLAIRYNRYSIVKLLLTDLRVTPICVFYNRHILKLMLKDIRMCPMDENYWLETDEKKIDELIELLLCDIRFDPQILFQIACQQGHTSTVRLLLNDPRVDPTADNNIAIGLASEYGHKKIVKLLLKNNKVNPCDNDHYALHYAAYYGHTDVLLLLLNDLRVINLDLYKLI